MKRETKNIQLKARFTEDEAQIVKDYAERHYMTISDVIRTALDKLIYLKEI